MQKQIKNTQKNIQYITTSIVVLLKNLKKLNNFKEFK